MIVIIVFVLLFYVHVCYYYFWVFADRLKEYMVLHLFRFSFTHDGSKCWMSFDILGSAPVNSWGLQPSVYTGFSAFHLLSKKSVSSGWTS